MRSAIEPNALRALQLAERAVGVRVLLEPAPFERQRLDLAHCLRPARPVAAVVAATACVARDKPARHLWTE